MPFQSVGEMILDFLFTPSLAKYRKYTSLLKLNLGGLFTFKIAQ